MALLIGNVQSFNVAAAEGVIVNGTQFKDTSGNVIHAHGGGMLKHGDYYYWYGEYRDDSNLFLGVSCYRSKDLVNWEYRGEVLSRNSAPELNHCNIERPKVMYNASTGEFVMWMHWENGINYGQARAAVAYSKRPTANSHTFEAFVHAGYRRYGSWPSGIYVKGLPMYLWTLTARDILYPQPMRTWTCTFMS